MSRISGLEDGLQEITSGGDAFEWLPYNTIKLYTNAFIVQDDKILLGLKKRGLGVNKFNGFGGKVEPQESSLEAAIRELREEAGIEANLKHVGVLFFLSEESDVAALIDIYKGSNFTGSITESDEMRPEWFSTKPENSETRLNQHDSTRLPTIPYDQMWETDQHWMPLLLSGTPFRGRSDFTMQNGRLLPSKWWFGGLKKDL